MLAQSIGVKIGKPMEHEAADAKHPNPHYVEDEEFRVNCQSCVVAYEMRRRGLPVEAHGRTPGCMGDKLATKVQTAWLTNDGKMPEPIVCKSELAKRTVDKLGRVRSTYTSNADVIQNFIGKTKEAGRYHVYWSWSNMNKGHIITMETFADGTRRFYDPQTGLEAKNILPWMAGKTKVTIDMKKGIKAYRVDNLQPNQLIVKGVIKKAGNTDFAPQMTKEQREWWAKNVQSTTSVLGGNSLKLADVQYKASNGGSISVNVQRLENANKNKQEMAKFEKEHRMCRILADNGYNIEMLEEKSGISSSDILINGKSADLKATKSAANIVKYAKKATRKQNADLVIFKFEDMTDEIHKELNKLSKMGIHGKFYINGTPNIQDF